MKSDIETPVSPKTANNPNNATGTRAFAGVIGVIAVILGVYAIVEPMGQRIDYLKRELDDLKQDLTDHEAIRAHAGSGEDKGVFNERFQEIETQFDRMRDVVNLNRAAWEGCATLLWKKVFGTEWPPSDYWPLGREEE